MCTLVRKRLQHDFHIVNDLINKGSIDIAHKKVCDINKNEEMEIRHEDLIPIQSFYSRR